MNDIPNFHEQNLAHAAAMEQGRKQILYVLCGSQAALQVLGQDYAAIKHSQKPLDELLHVHAHRFADDNDVAEKEIRNRAERVARRCAELGKSSTISPIDRSHLVDEIYDIRLPDSQIATVPDRAAEANFCDASQAQNLKRQLSEFEQRVTDARAQMTETNLPLLGRFLYGYHERPDFEDIQSHGKLGLMAAAGRWDPESRIRFSTYAKHYIKGYAGLYVENHGSLIRFPVYRHAELNALQEMETRHLALQGEIPSVEIVADALGLKPEKVEELRNIRRDDRPYEHPELYDPKWGVPKDAPKVFSPDRPDQAFEQTEGQQLILRALGTLTPREERVLKMRFGLDSGEEMTREEIAPSFQVTRERIRQIEAKALRKLRHPSRARALVPFANEDAQFEAKEASKREAEIQAARQAAWDAEAAARRAALALVASETAARMEQFNRYWAERDKQLEIARNEAAAHKAEQDAATREAARAEVEKWLQDPHVRMRMEDPRRDALPLGLPRAVPRSKWQPKNN